MPQYLKSALPWVEAIELELRTKVQEIIANVKLNGDSALFDYARAFDKLELDSLRVTDVEIAAAQAQLDDQLLADMQFGIDRIKRFAQAQLETLKPLDIETEPGVHLGHRLVPLEIAGAYVPGGRYPLLSAAQMAIIPAKVAGVKRIIMCTPARGDGKVHAAVLHAAKLSGADEIYKIGGAQAIAAMAYGTQSIPKVDKIAGPGNKFVAEAKRQILGSVGIDMIAGPSEILIIADQTANATWVAADLLAQAEHDPDTRVILVTDSEALARATLEQIKAQLETLPTADVAGIAWEKSGEIILTRDLLEACAVSDEIGPEHLEIHSKDPHALLEQLHNYGSVFIGEMAGVVFSDKVIGTNHILPTRAASRHTGGVWVGTFIKVLTHQWVTAEAADRIARVTARQSRREGLEGHARSADLRIKN